MGIDWLVRHELAPASEEMRAPGLRVAGNLEWTAGHRLVAPCPPPTPLLGIRKGNFAFDVKRRVACIWAAVVEPTLRHTATSRNEYAGPPCRHPPRLPRVSLKDE